MTGNSNAAIGTEAFQHNMSGIGNTASGYWSMNANTMGSSNTAAGHFSLVNNTTGSYNVAIGKEAGSNLTTGDHNIDIANIGSGGESGTIRIGTLGEQTKTFIQGIKGVQTSLFGIPVLVDANGQLGTNEGSGPTSANVPNSLVLRDTNGNFAAGTITANLTGHATEATNFTGSLSGEVTGAQSATVVSAAVAGNSPNFIVRRDGSGDFTNHSITLSGSLRLPHNPGSLTSGLITFGGTSFIHDAGFANVFAGQSAGNVNTTGSGNNAGFGYAALNLIGSGQRNTAIGMRSLNFDTTGSFNTAIGADSLAANNGDYNTATGTEALISNDSGIRNTATGWQALYTNTTGGYNTAVGGTALFKNNADYNTALGFGALNATTGGASNTAVGVDACRKNTSGSENVAVGVQALYSNTGGQGNIAIGRNALHDGDGGIGNIAIGSFAGRYLTGVSNIYIGRIGDPAAAGAYGRVEIGEPGINGPVYIHGIYNHQLGGADRRDIQVNEFGELGVNTVSVSSRRYKFDINDMSDVTDDLLHLRPVTFRYRRDGLNALLQYGLIAEEVEQFYPTLVGYNREGKPETVKYEFLAPMLLNEVQKQHKTIDTLNTTTIELRAENASLREQLEALMRRVEQLETIRVASK